MRTNASLSPAVSAADDSTFNSSNASAAGVESAPSKRVSPAKLVANRANARRSTGPKIDAGKARASMNAVRHGLAARASLLPGEDADELATLAEEMRADLKPRGAAEGELVGRIVSLSWRLRRLARAEETLWADDDQNQIDRHERWQNAKAAYNLPTTPWESNAPPKTASAAQFVARQFASPDKHGTSALERMAVYEQRLDRALHAALRQLQQLRKMRGEDDVEEEALGADRVADESIAHERVVENGAAAPIESQSTLQNEPTASDEIPNETRPVLEKRDIDACASQKENAQNEPNAFSETGVWASSA